MTFLIFWLGFSLIVGVAASKRNRSGAAWFFLSLIFSPLLAGLFMLALGENKPSGRYEAAQVVEVEPRSKTFGPILEKKCPDCAEMVKADARICRFCRHEF
ncbi:MAG: zinc ribbon domain-containing protein [Mesorhizobium sp.]|uniref:zinc ribbon domain-containing protein n=1 Tax=Mesorhizobium sp. TaxID=1871066 RepID=UPI0012228CF8|nr:zinc ribbon domain-containing protein [Mesorhizobium sp.]TIQ85259.1 MAG: zinc ribbon domain-containing protein [Mesorhizobium sp.]